MTGPRPSTLAVQALLIIAVCVLVYWRGLGGAGLTLTEGHRAIPGWAMLEGGDPFLPTLFERPYLRKPPGMPWAVAALGAVLGPTEFSARAVSALSCTLMALLAFLFAARWFGPRFAPWAGLAQALSPLFWSPGRSAEIEALNLLGTLLAVLGIIDLFTAARRDRLLPCICVALGVIIAGLAKGPASAPVLAAAIFAAFACRVRPVRSPWAHLAAALLLALAVLAFVGFRIAARARGLGDLVGQGPGDFLWERSRLAGIALLIPAAVLSALPFSLLVFPALRAESPTARAMGWSAALALLFFMALGISNARYAMPVFVLAPPLLAWAAARMEGYPWRDRARGLAWTLTPRFPFFACLALLIGSFVFVHFFEAQRARASGRSAGGGVAQILQDHRALWPDGVIPLWADGLVEARPEVLWYAAARGRELGLEPRPYWISLRRLTPALFTPGRSDAPPGHLVLLLRRDALGDEVADARTRGLLEHAQMVGELAVHKFSFQVWIAPMPRGFCGNTPM